MTRQLISLICFLALTSTIFAQTGTPISQIFLDENNVSGGGFQGDVTITIINKAKGIIILEVIFNFLV
jgi:hypothetical protein